MNKGATLIELLLAIGIFSLLFYLSASALINIQKSRLLKDNLWRLALIIRQAQSRSQAGEASQDSHLSFGVLFTQNSYQEFATLSNYSQRLQVHDLEYKLPKSLNLVNLNLPNSCLTANDCLIFSGLEATISAQAQVSLKNIKTNETGTVFINSQGQVSY